jgi:hypothetical protein
MDEHNNTEPVIFMLSPDDMPIDDEPYTYCLQVITHNMNRLKDNKKYNLTITFIKYEENPDGTRVSETRTVLQFVNQSKMSDMKHSLYYRNMKYSIVKKLAFFCSHQFEMYSEIELTFSPIPDEVDPRKLKAFHSTHVNCMLQVIADQRPKHREKILAFETDGTLCSLKPLAVETNDRYTFKDMLGNHLLTIKGRSYGNKNINMFVHDNHAYAEELKMPKEIFQFVLVCDPAKEVDNEPYDVAIYFNNDSNGGIDSYVTSAGKLVKRQKLHEEVSQYAELNNFTEDTQRMNSTRSVDFSIFKSNYKKTIYFKEEIKQSMLEIQSFNIWYQDTDYKNYDMNGAFCSVNQETNLAYDYYNMFQIPQHCHLNISNPDIQFVTSVSGFCRISNVSFNPKTHPHIKNVLNKNAMFHTAMIKFMIDNNIATFTVDWMCWSPQTVPLIFNTPDNKINRVMIGKCFQSSFKRVYVRDQLYRDYLINKYRESTLSHWSTTTLYFKNAKSGYFEVRSSVLAYHNIAMFKVIMMHEPADILKIGTDNIFVKNGKFNGIMSTLPGQFKLDKPNKQTYIYNATIDPLANNNMFEYEELYVNPQVSPDNALGKYNMNQTVHEVLKHSISYITGYGGSGKSTLFYKIASEFPDHQILTPTKILADKKYKEFQQKINITNWQHYFMGTCGKEFTSGIAAGCHQKLVIWDEACMVSYEDLSVYIPYLLGQGAAIVCIGDPGQLEPFAGISPHEYLKSIATYQYHFTSDYRSKDEHTKTMKNHIRGLEENIAISYIKKQCGYHMFNEFLQHWTPKDIVYASTRDMNKYITDKLIEVHEEKFPDEPVPIIYLEDVVDSKGKKMCSNTLSTMKIGEKLPKHTTYAYTSTIHKSIGDTVISNIYIISDRNSSVWCKNGVYTAFSRCERSEQIKIVALPDDIRKDAHTITLTDEVILKRIQSHKSQDMKKQIYTAEDYIDIVYVKELLDKKVCVHCKMEVKQDVYFDRDSCAWSVDRIDNKIGHIKSNCQLSCYSCNIHHK